MKNNDVGDDDYIFFLETPAPPPPFKKKKKKMEEIRVPELKGGEGGGRNKGFWPEYLLMHN